MYPYSTQNRKIKPVPPGFDGHSRPAAAPARWLPWYLLPFLAGAAFLIYYRYTLDSLPTRGQLNLAFEVASVMAVIGLTVGLSKGLLKRNFPLWKLTRTAAVIYVLWLLAGLVALAANLLIGRLS